MTSIIAEEFSCTPDQAGVQDLALCRRIIHLRRFRDAWRDIESEQEDMPDDYWHRIAIKAKVAILRGEA